MITLMVAAGIVPPVATRRDTPSMTYQVHLGNLKPLGVWVSHSEHTNCLDPIPAQSVSAMGTAAKRVGLWITLTHQAQVVSMFTPSRKAARTC